MKDDAFQFHIDSVIRYCEDMIEALHPEVDVAALENVARFFELHNFLIQYIIASYKETK